MSYYLERFGNLLLPAARRSDAGAGDSRVDALLLPGGGLYDAQGSERSPRDLTRVRLRADLAADCPADLRERYGELRALRGERATLYRRHTDGRRESILARLVEVGADWDPSNLRHLEVDLRWLLLEPYWCGAVHDVTTVLDTAPKTVTLSNGGNVAATDVILTLTAVGEDLDGLAVAVAGAIDWTWTGDLDPGEALVVDTAARSVEAAGADAYAGFAFGAGQAVGDWLRLEPGENAVVVTADVSASFSASGLSTLRAQYCDAWE